MKIYQLPFKNFICLVKRFDMKIYQMPFKIFTCKVFILQVFPYSLLQCYVFLLSWPLIFSQNIKNYNSIELHYSECLSRHRLLQQNDFNCHVIFISHSRIEICPKHLSRRVFCQNVCFSLSPVIIFLIRSETLQESESTSCPCRMNLITVIIRLYNYFQTLFQKRLCKKVFCATVLLSPPTSIKTKTKTMEHKQYTGKLFIYYDVREWRKIHCT